MPQNSTTKYSLHIILYLLTGTWPRRDAVSPTPRTLWAWRKRKRRARVFVDFSSICCLRVCGRAPLAPQPSWPMCAPRADVFLIELIFNEALLAGENNDKQPEPPRSSPACFAASRRGSGNYSRLYVQHFLRLRYCQWIQLVQDVEQLRSTVQQLPFWFIFMGSVRIHLAESMLDYVHSHECGNLPRS